MKKAVITGGAGFIGSHLVEALVERGVTTVVIDNLSYGSWEKIPELAREKTWCVEGDCLDATVLDECFRDADCVFHLAAVSSVEASLLDPLASTRCGEMALLGVLEAARRCGVTKIVYASSAAVYGNPSELPITEAHTPQPLSYYGVSKLAGEYYLSAFTRLSGSTATALRFFNVYGPRQDPANPFSGVISKFIAATQAEKPPTIFGDGEQTRDFVYVADAVAALLAAQERRREGFLSLNVASGEQVSVAALARLVAAACGVSVTPYHRSMRRGEIRNSAGDPRKAKELLGFTAQWSVAQGLHTMCSLE